MRRLLLAIALTALVFAGAPRASEASPGRAACEAYCAVAGGGCYVFLGLFLGKDKCDALYKGCVEGCVAGLNDPEPGRE